MCLNNSNMRYILVYCMFFVSIICVPQDNTGITIINGNIAKPAQFPYMVSIRVRGSHTCGGTIISNHWVLTAAHCVNGKFMNLQDIEIVAGSHTLNHGGWRYTIIDRHVHPNWKQNTHQHDLALLKVDRSFDTGKLVSIASLGTTPTPAGVWATVSGWGATPLPAPAAANRLRYELLETVAPAQCARRWAGHATITAAHLCVVGRHQPPPATCSGDSGAPLVHDGTVVAVHVLGDSCKTGRPAIAVRVSSHLDWIRDHMH